MTTVTLRPNGTIDNNALTAVGGAGTVHGVLSDDSDSTYVTHTAGGYAWLDLGTFTLPAGAVTKSAYVALRARAETGLTPGRARATLAVPELGDYTPLASLDDSTVGDSAVTLISGASSALPYLYQSNIDGLALYVRPSNSPGYGTRLYEAYAYITYALAPTTAATAPTGTQATTTPTVAWTHTINSDGGPQTYYWVKVFTAAQYGAGGFDPETSTAEWSTGAVLSGATSLVVGEPLASGTYRAYVKTAQTTNGVAHWADWAYSGFTVDVSTPEVASVTTAVDATDGSVDITVTRAPIAATVVGSNTSYTSSTSLVITAAANVPARSVVVVRVAADNLNATTPTFTVADSKSNTWSLVTQSAVNATPAAGVAGAVYVSRISTALVIGDTITITLSGAVVAKAAHAHAYSGLASATPRQSLNSSAASTAFTAGPATSAVAGDIVIGTGAYEHVAAQSTGDTDTTNGSWSSIVNATTSGTTNTGVQVFGQHKTITAAGNQTYDFTLSNSSEWLSYLMTMVGLPWTAVIVERSLDGGATWEFVRGATEQVPSNADTFTVTDYEVPNGTSVTYRARCSAVNGGATVTGAWATSTSTSWTSTKTFLKDSYDPALNVSARFEVAFDVSRPVRSSAHSVLGRRAPIIVVDAEQSERGRFALVTTTAAEAVDLQALIAGASSRVVLVQAPTSHRLPFDWVHIANVTETRMRTMQAATRVWECDFVAVDRPADDGMAP